MPVSCELTLTLDEGTSPAALTLAAARSLAIDPARVSGVVLKRRSLDARPRPPRWVCQVETYIDEAAPPLELPTPLRSPVAATRQVIVVGCGPAGMFAALRLLELGLRPVIVERGKDVQARRHDLARITRQGLVDPDSNYCFGEGGAGTYSDGKLYTRATKRGSIESVLRTLVAHGAPPGILVDAHPHIGSNRLPRVVAAMRETILARGGEVHFGTRVVDLIMEQGQVRGVRTHDGRELLGESVVLATGHSARDIFDLLVARGIQVEAKPFAMGVRIEHPQPLIDQLQYKCPERHSGLPAAAYRLAHTVDGRGVFSFCMCPGGWIVPAATTQDELVVNGMSLSRRDSPYACSGMVVAIELEDLLPYQQHGPLAGLACQRSLEAAAALAGGGLQRAPAQRVTDFIAGRPSQSLPRSSYHPGLVTAPLAEVLGPGIASRLREGLRHFGRHMRGYVTEEAVLVGVESRTSSPVRIPRHPESLEHPEVRGLFPCGEGGGYAGGIVSAAMDGVRVAEKAASRAASSR